MQPAFTERSRESATVTLNKVVQGRDIRLLARDKRPIMDHDSVRRRHPTPASPIVSRRPAAMPVTPRSGATPTAPRQMRFVPAAAPQVTPVTPQATPASPVMAPRRWGIKQCANFAAPSQPCKFRWTPRTRTTGATSPLRTATRPRRASRITGGTDDDDRRPPHFLSLSQIPSTIACNT